VESAGSLRRSVYCQLLIYFILFVQISEIHTKVAQIAPNSMDQTVDHILTWLQTRYQNQQFQRLGNIIQVIEIRTIIC